MIIIVIDANPIISSLIGGISREIIFSPLYKFITTQYTIEEVEKYLSYIGKKSGVNLEEIKEAFELLPIEIYNKNFYEAKMKEAQLIIGNIDRKDIDILALVLETHYPLWTEDKDFGNIPRINVIKTKDLV